MFNELQAFVSEQTGEVHWVDSYAIGRNMIMTPDILDPSLQRIIQECQAQFTYVRYYHDKEIASQHRHHGHGIRRPSEMTGLERLEDTVRVTFPELTLQTSSRQWLGIFDIITNLFFATDSAEQENADEVETLRYKGQLLNQPLQDRITPVIELQTAVRSETGRNVMFYDAYVSFLCCVDL